MQCVRLGSRIVPNAVSGKGDRGAELPSQRFGDGGEREILDHSTFGSSEVGSDDDPGAGFSKALDRAQGGSDPRVIDDLIAVEGDIEVGADQDSDPRKGVRARGFCDEPILKGAYAHFSILIVAMTESWAEGSGQGCCGPCRRRGNVPAGLRADNESCQTPLRVSGPLHCGAKGA